MQTPRLVPPTAVPPASGLPAVRCRRSGFTIVEVMMAAAVMALAITTSITTMQQGFVALDTSRNVTTAGQIMQCELERMRLKDWSTTSVLTSGTVTIDPAYTSNAAIGNRFTMTRTVSDVHTDTMKQITLKISWRSYDGRPLSRSYSSYYGKNGLYDYFYNTTYSSLY
jgi:prepilin-type N-terminal cleavage/methylation domain-containing protein